MMIAIVLLSLGALLVLDGAVQMLRRHIESEQLRDYERSSHRRLMREIGRQP